MQTIILGKGDFPHHEADGKIRNKEKAEHRDSSKETYDKLATEKIDFSKVKVESLFEDMVDFDTFSTSDFRAVKVKNCEEVPTSKNV